MYCFFFCSPFLSAVSLRSDRSFCYRLLSHIYLPFYINFSNFVCNLLYVCYRFSLICFSYLSLGVQISQQAAYFCTLFYHISLFLIYSYSFHSIYLYFNFFNFLRILAHPQRSTFQLTVTKLQFFSLFLYNTLLSKYEYAFFHVFITFRSLLV